MRRVPAAVFALLVPVVLLGPLPGYGATLEAQTLRSFTTFRQRHGEHTLNAQLRFVHGSFRLAPSRAGELYRVDLAYDPASYAPVSRFESTDTLVLMRLVPEDSGAPVHVNIASDGGEPNEDAFAIRIGGKKRAQQSATLALSPDVDATLKLVLIGAKSDLDLGGRRISALDINTNGGATTVQFSTPNGVGCRHASVSANVGRITLLNLGNSRCEMISLDGNATEAVIDLGGAWASDASIHAAVTAGRLTLRLPRQIGIRLSLARFLTDFTPNGLVRKGDAFVSPNYGDAGRRIDISVASTLSGVSVEWVGE